MAGMRTPIAIGLMGLLLGMTPGCSDQVVGLFDSVGTGEASSSESGEPLGTSSSGGAVDSTTSDGGDESSTGPGIELGPCVPEFVDPFDEISEENWTPWQEEDSSVGILEGQLKFIPATARQADGEVSDAGIVGTSYSIPLSNRALRMRVSTPPGADENVLIFLMIMVSDSESMSIRLHPTLTIAATSMVPGESYEAAFEALTPEWIGIALVDDEVHYQVSEDGETWTNVYTGPAVTTALEGRPLVMTQTYGDSPTPTTVFADDLTVCEF